MKCICMQEYIYTFKRFVLELSSDEESELLLTKYEEKAFDRAAIVKR